MPREEYIERGAFAHGFFELDIYRGPIKSVLKLESLLIEEGPRLPRGGVSLHPVLDGLYDTRFSHSPCHSMFCERGLGDARRNVYALGVSNVS